MSRSSRSMEWTPLLFSGGLAFFLFALFAVIPFGDTAMKVGTMIHQQGGELGAANLVTAVVLGYRGLDTLGELAILFAAATSAGLVLSNTRQRTRSIKNKGLGELFESAISLLMPLLLLVGVYIVLHGHLTPGGGFQGGVVIAVALFLPTLARGEMVINHHLIQWIEGGAGALFILIGVAALIQGAAFLQPLMAAGEVGRFLSAGTLPVLYLLVGLKVGAELAALLGHLVEDDEPGVQQ
jgi:multicomponent Na+:H+ antiporter subunit B